MMINKTTNMWNEMEHSGSDQRSHTKAQHRIDDLVVDGSVTKLDDHQAAQRDDGDDEYRNCSVAVHCIHTHSNRFT